MIPFTCPCCGVACPPHRDGCSLHHDCPTDAEVFDEVSSLRSEVTRLREERRWIPVGERLPDLDVEVLVWQQGYTAIGWREHRPWYTVPKTIWTLGDELDKGYPPEKITHWMPLPAPPKGGEVE
jgi:hypothetical protein